MGELVKGAKTKSGQTIGLTENPARDTNYRYGMTVIGDNNVIIMALPKSPGLGAFAVVGTPDNDRSDFYYNPKGPNLEFAKKLYSMGHEGGGFKRLASSVPAQTAVSAPAQTTDFFELVQSGTSQDVQAAISNGADVKAKDKDGMTALILAAGANQDPEVITALVKAGADVNIQVSNGTFKVTPLVAAAWQNANPEVVAALLKAGADLSRDGGMALGVAAAYNPNSEMVLELLKAGADAKFKDASGKTAFFYAQQRADLKGTDALQKLQAASQ
jgi:ribosomal protein L12E/L44/L45/RPP1/RPP2